MNENMNAILEVVSDKIDSFDIAFQFVLEELEAASIAGKENIFLKNFVENTGINPIIYKDAMSFSNSKVEEIQELLRVTLTLIHSDKDSMVMGRVNFVEYIMKKWKENNGDRLAFCVNNF